MRLALDALIVTLIALVTLSVAGPHSAVHEESSAAKCSLDGGALHAQLDSSETDCSQRLEELPLGIDIDQRIATIVAAVLLIVVRILLGVKTRKGQQ